MNQRQTHTTGISTGKVLKYTLMPEVLPRLHSLFGSGFGHIALFIAYIFGMMRLLPSSHPYLSYSNIGRYGIRHVVAEAARHLEYKKENTDKILIFYTIIVGLALLMLQFGIMIAAAITQVANATGIGGGVSETYSSFFVTEQPEKDIAYNFLDLVFGFEGIFQTGGELTETANAGNWPTPFHEGMHALFQFYNTGILGIALIIFLYYVFIVVGETAQSGTPFGRRFNKAWAPVRLIVAVAMLMPLTDIGINGVQYFTLNVAKWGSSLATNTWFVFLDKSGTLAGTTTPLGSPNSLVARASPPPTNEVAEFFMLARACQISYTVVRNDERVKPYIEYNGETIDFTGDLSYEEALDFVERNDMTIRIGRKGDEFATHSGNVEPTCGEMVFETIALGGEDAAEEAGSTFGDDPTSESGGVIGAYLIRKCYFEMMQTLWNLPASTQISANLVFKYTPTAHKVPDIELVDGTGYASTDDYVRDATNYFIHKLTREEAPAIESKGDPGVVTAINAGDWGGLLDFSGGLSGWLDGLFGSIGDFFSGIFSGIGGFFSGLGSLFGGGGGGAGGGGAGGGGAGGGGAGGGGAGGGGAGGGGAGALSGTEPGEINCRNIFNEAREAQINSDWTYQHASYGWAGAGIWYNRIAEVNGEIITASYHMPTIRSYPQIMEAVEAARIASSEGFDRDDRFNPISRSGQLVEFPSARDQIIAIILNEGKAIWPESNNAGAASQNSPIIDTLQGFFGLRGLFQMQQNSDIHPLAQLATIGKSLIDSAVVNFGIAVGGGILGMVTDGNVGTIAKNVSSFSGQIGMIGLSIGFILFYVIPILPFAFFFFAVGGWVKGLFEAMVGLPLWALAHIRIDGEGIPGPVGMNGYYLVFEIFVRPVLIVVGLLAAVTIFAVQVAVLNEIWDLVSQNVAGGEDTTDLSDAEITALVDPSYMRSIVDTFFMTILYTVIVYMLGMGSFKLIDAIPNSIMRWMGASVQTFGEQAGNPAAQLTQTMFQSSQKVTGNIGQAFGGINNRTSELAGAGLI